MYRVVILSFVIVTVLAKELDNKQCKHAVGPAAMGCCKQGPDTFGKFMTEDLGECVSLSIDPIKCERELCMAKKKGFATDDGKIDKAKLVEVLTQEFASKPDVLEDVISECVNGDIDMYAPAVFCDFIKIRICIFVQKLNHCPERDEDSEDCKEMKKIVEECEKQAS